ncbi:TRAP transporter small permease [Reinekea thalattae]|uniref:TRAP transporter small permease protein n=2 Tax=Reinekea thalattae TaxID=2593301 RepID=A0A5C8ZAJ2_9GAMM|nr:TRAP transporter small permease [Reinekea thalattae]
MILLAVTQILLRNFVGISLFWIDPFNRLLVLWLALLGAMVATREREHISIDLLRHYSDRLWFKTLQRIAYFFSALVCALVAFHSSRFVYDEFVYQTTTFSNLPAWPFQLIMPIGFLVMALRFAHALVGGTKLTHPKTHTNISGNKRTVQ